MRPVAHSRLLLSLAIASATMLLTSGALPGQAALSGRSTLQGRWMEVMMAGREDTDDAQAKQAAPAEPEMVAATEKAFLIGPGTTRVVLHVHAPTGPARHRQPGTGAIFLRIENVTCDTVAPNFSAFLNVPAGAVPEDHPELFAGGMGMFGLPEASAIKSEHGGSGKGFTLDISRLFHTLELRRDWNPRELSISFVPQFWDSPVPQVRVGRVSLYLQ